MPLFQLMVAYLMTQRYLFTDDTPVKMQAKGRCREARVWVYVGALPNAPPYHVYQFSEDRGHRHPISFLKQFSGTIHGDAFGAYESLDADPQSNVSWAPCWVHGRRKFEELQPVSDVTRTTVLRLMRALFRYEKIAWNNDAPERQRIRRECETPIVDTLFALLKEKCLARELLPKSKLAEAVGYMLNREEKFRRYLADPNLRMDNNTAERALRKLTIGRKNWLFVGSPKAGESMAALLSLVQTCRAMDIRPQEYLQDIFDRLLDHPHSRLEELLPDRWKQMRAQQQQVAQPANGL